MLMLLLLMLPHLQHLLLLGVYGGVWRVVCRRRSLRVMLLWLLLLLFLFLHDCHDAVHVRVILHHSGRLH